MPTLDGKIATTIEGRYLCILAKEITPFAASAVAPVFRTHPRPEVERSRSVREARLLLFAAS